jgi:hypothetical protein
MRSGIIPEWVPLSVQQIASALPFGTTVAERLLTDKKMKAFWRMLRLANVNAAAIAGVERFQRLSNWGIADEGVSLQDQTAAAFFAFAVMELSSKRTVWTRANAEKLAERFDSAVDLCRWIMRDPMFDPELAAAAATMVPGLERHAVLLREQRRLVHLGQNDAPYMLEQSSGKRNDDLIRGKARALAAEMYRLFGSYHYGSVAIVIAVALQTRRISSGTVRNWCANLSSP